MYQRNMRMSFTGSTGGSVFFIDYSHASIAVAFSDLIIMNMLIAGTQGP